MKDNMQVLFATDFSQASKIALQTAELLHKTYQADISLLNVLSNVMDAASDAVARIKKKNLIKQQKTQRKPTSRIQPKHKPY